MSVELRKKIAQMLCFGFNGTSLETSTNLKSWLSHPDGLGSLIFFDYDLPAKAYPKNILSLQQLKQLSAQIKSFYNDHHPELPIWLSIDVEGGRVDRLARMQDYPLLPSAYQIAHFDLKKRTNIWSQSAALLKDLGIDINFSPVVDLNLSPHEGIFGPLERCFSDESQKVTELAREYLLILKKFGVKGCIKHFPGHGSATHDSHLDFVDVTDTFDIRELEPFKDLIAESNLVDCVMTAHVINRHLDSSGLPATLSSLILTQLLRQEMHYDGLIFSDDLQMQAISKHFSRDEALVKTINAGADIIIFGNQLGVDTPTEVIDSIERLINHGAIELKHIENAFQRIQKFKGV